MHIAFLVTALNDLNILACDIQNAYLTADCREKIYIIKGLEFGSEASSIMLVKKALYIQFGDSITSNFRVPFLRPQVQPMPVANVSIPP